MVLQQHTLWSLYSSLVGDIRCQCCMSKVVRWVCRCYDWTSLIRSYVGLHHFFSHSPTPKPMYDTILSLICVRYNLESCLCTIQSCDSLLYDINLRATATTILRTRGVQIPIDLVSSATDSYGQSVVLFKPMSVPTSDPKSEFLYQSSYIVHDLQTSP